MKNVVSLLILCALFAATPLLANSVPRMDKEELRAKLGSGNLVILDVRQGRDWSSSEFKIEDAVRVDNGDLSVAKNYPKDTTIVLYCA